MNSHENITNNTLDDNFYNDCFRYRMFCKMLASYSEYWRNVLCSDFSGSWNTLQDTLDCLRTLNKFSSINKTIAFAFLENQLLGLEKIYPYNLFASTEMITESVCSICGENIDSFVCPHIQGELYRGKVAYSRGKIKALLSVSIVEHPVDKRCVMKNVDGNEVQFPVVNYLRDALTINKISPLRISHFVETNQAAFHLADNLERKSPCHCGSMKKYKDCCESNDLKIKHIRMIRTHGANGLSVDNLVKLNSVPLKTHSR